MDFNLSSEQRLLREGAQRYLRDQHSFLEYRELVHEDRQPDRKHWNAFAEMGWLALPVSEDHGGLGLAMDDVSVLMEELGRSLVVEPYLTNAVLCARILERSPPSQFGKDLLSQMVGGSATLALAHAEPGRRYEAPAGTLAVRGDNTFTLNGKKTLVIGGPSAGTLIVTAQVEGKLAMFVVDASTPGVSRQDYLLVDRSGASDFEFNGVSLRGDALIAQGQEAIDILEEAMDRATLATVAQMQGVMEAAVAATSEHVKSRIAFEAPLGKLQAVQHMLADAFIELQESRSILYRGLAEFDLGPQARRLAVSAAKAYAGPSAKQVCAICVQLHGGYGITDEYLVGHCYRKIVLLEKLFGDTHFHTERFAMDAFASPVPRPLLT